MRPTCRLTGIVPLLVAAALLGVPNALGQDAPPPAESPAPAAGAPTDRFFLAFAEEAAVARSQWWEGQVEFLGGNAQDVFVGDFVMALQLYKNLEIGGRVGFGSSSASDGGPDGTGATDLDAWGKYLFRVGSLDVAAGALLSVPTGDDSAGLGDDGFDLEFFGSVAHRGPRFVLAGQAGIRFNGDGTFRQVDYDGDTSLLLGGGILFPVTDVFTVIGELRYESSRVERGDDDFRVLGGVHWRTTGTAVVRGAVGAGLTDGAPDFQVLLSYAWTF